MRSSRAAGLALLFLLLLFLHFSLRPLLAWKAGVDFLLIAVLLVSVRVGAGGAAVLGLVGGLAADSLAPSAFGSATLAMTLVATLSSWIRSSFFGEHLMLNALFLLAGKIAFDAVFLIIEQRLTGMALVMQLVTWSALSAVVTAIIGLGVLVLFRPFIESSTGPMRS